MRIIAVAMILMLAACSSALVTTGQPATFKHPYGEGYITPVSSPPPSAHGGYYDTNETVWLDTTSELLLAVLELYVHGHVGIEVHDHHD